MAETVQSGLIAQGERVRDFEKRIARRLRQRDGVAVNSGTSALHLALLGLGIRARDAVAIPSYSCAALLHAVEHAGGRAVFVDIRAGDYNLDPEDLRRKRGRKRLAAVIVPHMFGRVCDLSAVREAAGPGVPVIEDCAHAIGDPEVGSGDVLACSFYATKMMTTGEGGMVLSADAGLLARVRDLRDYDEKQRHRVRFNYKMTDIQAALGVSQLQKLDGFLQRRQKLSRRYGREVRTCFRYVVAVDETDAVITKFEDAGIQARRPVFWPLHRYAGLPDPIFHATTKAMREYVSIPLYPALTEEEADRIVTAMEGILR